MIRTLTRYLSGRHIWLALAGALEAAISAEYFLLLRASGPLTLHSWHSTALSIGRLTLAAAALTIAAGFLESPKSRRWLLVLNGLALAGLGAIETEFYRYRISLLTVSLLVIAMALTIGALSLKSRVAAVASLGFAFVFLALGLHWIAMGPESHPDILCLGLYFAFSAIYKLGFTEPSPDISASGEVLAV